MCFFYFLETCTKRDIKIKLGLIGVLTPKGMESGELSHHQNHCFPMLLCNEKQFFSYPELYKGYLYACDCCGETTSRTITVSVCIANIS